MWSSHPLNKWYAYHLQQNDFVKHERFTYGMLCLKDALLIIRRRESVHWEILRWEFNSLQHKQGDGLDLFLLLQAHDSGVGRFLGEMDYGPGALQKLKIIGKNNERYLVAYRIGQSDWAYGGMTFKEARKLLKKPGWQQQTEETPGFISRFYVREIGGGQV